MQVLVLYNRIENQSAALAEIDVIKQRDLVVDCVTVAGHEVSVFPVDLNLESIRTKISEIQPDVVFNLVESLNGSDRLASVVPLLLESLGTPFTGSGSLAIQLSSNKLTAKKRLVQCGLTTPDWWDHELLNSISKKSAPPSIPPTVIIAKSVWEHASFGMDDSAVRQALTIAEIDQHLKQFEQKFGVEFFCERYVEGREFNLSCLSDDEGVAVLPPAEIDFVDYPQNKPKIVGYEAKWKEDSFEYVNTPRRFQFPKSDLALLNRLRRNACEAWNAFEVSGYARVDFRVDSQGHPFVLEVNTNPCLSLDAGFAAACLENGLSMQKAIWRIIQSAFEGSRNEHTA